jgi:hypothetical protein
VNWLLKRQQTHRTPAVIRMERNYGSEGIALYGAAQAWAIPGVLVVGVGTILLFLSPVLGSRLPSAVVLLAGAAIACPAFLRLAQGARAGRQYRSGRPLEKPNP